MANKFARSNGDFNNASIWSLSATGLSATTVPTIGDNAIANTYTVQITGSVACDNITNGTAYGGLSGGRFVLNATTTTAAVTSSLVAVANSSAPLLSSTGSNNIYLKFASVTGGVSFSPIFVINNSGNITTEGYLSRQFDVVNSSNWTHIGDVDANPTGIGIGASATVVIYGNLLMTQGGSNHRCMQINSSGANVVIYGNITASSAGSLAGGSAILMNNPCSLTVYGNILGSATSLAAGISNLSTGSVTVYGNLNANGSGTAISNTSTGSVTVLGNVTGDSRGGAGIASSNAAANVRISGNLIGAPNGIPAVYAASYTVNPVPYQTYIRYANNGTGVGSDAYLYHYTTDSLSSFSMPPVSAVRAGLQYADNTLTGTCQIPPVSSVAFGALVGNTTGTAALTSNNLFDASIASLTATDSVGARLKNSATVESVGRILASFSN